MRNWSQLEVFIEDLMDKENIAGVAIAISKNGEVIYKNGFGYNSRGRGTESQCCNDH